MSEWKDCKTIFSNGTEFEIFCSQCEKCTLYRNGRCRTYARIVMGMFDKGKFPFDDLLDHEKYGGKKCKRMTTEPIRRNRKEKQTQGQLSFLESEG